MTYRIEGLAPDAFQRYFAMGDAELRQHGAIRITAAADRGFPCRISLQDARAGDELILLHHVSHDAPTPYRSAYAIYVRAVADTAAVYEDAIPPVFEGRPLGLRGFDRDGMLKNALLALPGQADEKIRELFEQGDIAYIHAHNAAHGCFSARVDRA